MTPLNKMNSLFKNCPYNLISEFEIDNFHKKGGSSYARFVITTINRIRKIDSDLETETRTFEKNQLIEERDTLVKLLEDQNEEQLTAAVSNWQLVEKDYWTEHLGKIAAIEILTYGKVSYETMLKMAQLPEELYIKSTQICVKLANTIKTATQDAEELVGITQSAPETSAPTATKPIKKLLLKNIK